MFAIAAYVQSGLRRLAARAVLAARLPYPGAGIGIALAWCHMHIPPQQRQAGGAEGYRPSHLMFALSGQTRTDMAN